MRAKKSLGQNFLVDTGTASRIVDAVSPTVDEMVLEIGPGHGALTGLLIRRAGLVVAVEIDRELVDLLHTEFPDERLSVVEADILQTDISRLAEESRRTHPQLQPFFRVVANLPYYISTAVIMHLIKSRALIKDLTLMLQREVVERIISPPGGRDYGALSVMVQLYCKTKKLFNVSPGAFRPVPKVDSAVLRLEMREESTLPHHDTKLFSNVLRASFAQRRKTILNSLKANASLIDPKLKPEMILSALENSGISPERRAETVSPAEFIRLTETFSRGY